MDRRTVLTRVGAGVAALAATALLCASVMLFSLPVVLAQENSQEPSALHIGVLAPLSGPFEPLGRQVERGVVLAVEAYARQTGLGVTITTADDRCDEAGGRDAANQLLGAQVDVVIGGVCWRPALAARDVFNLQDIRFYASGVRYGGLTDDAVPGLLRINGRDDQQGVFLADALIEGALDDLIGGSLRARPLVILYTDGSYGRTLAESVRDQVADAGLVVAMYEAFEPDEGVLEAASRARAEDPGLVLVLAGQADSALMVSALRDALGETPILAGDSVLTPEFPLLADAGAEGVVFARPTVWVWWRPAWLQRKLPSLRCWGNQRRRMTRFLDRLSSMRRAIWNVRALSSGSGVPAPYGRWTVIRLRLIQAEVQAFGVKPESHNAT
jgi:ABC-type branched-subunit amino acid transport system substrate-binding protein